MSERKAMFDPVNANLSLSLQCKILSLSRSSAYYWTKGECAAALALMWRIDELFMTYPFYGSNQMQAALDLEGIADRLHRVRRLMGLMRLQAIYQKPNTSKPHPEHSIYSYKLRKPFITRLNHAWYTDITYIPMQRGFYIWSLKWTGRHCAFCLGGCPIRLTPSFCLGALDQAIEAYGRLRYLTRIKVASSQV